MASIRYISVFSGIEAASVAWGPLGWEPVAFCEIDPFPSAVLAHRFPNVPNLGDITKVDWEEVIAEYGTADIVVGGSPCQSFSIAGGREGLDGESRLMYEYIRCVQETRPRWFLWENVPGVFSIDGGRAYGILIRAMEELGYGMSWRVLDAQFFGVAQRRRRVFLVGCAGERVGASAAVLFEPESVSGNTQSSREKRQELTRAVEERARSGGFKFHQGARAGGVGYEDEQSPTLTADYHNPACLAPWDTQIKRIFDPSGVAQITSPQNGNRPQPNDPCQTLDTDSRAAVVYSLQSDGSEVCTTNYGHEIAGTLTRRMDSSPGYQQGQNIVCMSDVVDKQSVVCLQDGQANGGICEDHAPTLNCMHEQPIVIDRAAFNQGEGALYSPHIEQTELMDSLVARGPHAVAQPTQEI